MIDRRAGEELKAECGRQHEQYNRRDEGTHEDSRAQQTGNFRARSVTSHDVQCV